METWKIYFKHGGYTYVTCTTFTIEAGGIYSFWLKNGIDTEAVRVGYFTDVAGVKKVKI